MAVAFQWTILHYISEDRIIYIAYSLKAKNQTEIYSASHSKVAPENVGLHLHVIPVWNAVATGNVLLYVQCTLHLLQLCRRTWAQLFAAVITHRTRKMLSRHSEDVSIFFGRASVHCEDLLDCWFH
jgi:hypothetical protein